MANIGEKFSSLLRSESNEKTRDEAAWENLDPDELKEDLDECLKNIRNSGSFAVIEKLTNPPNPGIYLKHGGVIGLPLSDRDAEAIIAASHQAPFGKGEETVVDTSVRKTWEISHGDFAINNPAWEPFLSSIVTKVSAGLGVEATGKGVSAQLYKMLLYDEGAMFKPHQDSEKAPHMFATLVIALPSKHEGGEVRVTNSGETHILETSMSSDFDASFLAWFSDVTHEVKPVLSGRRLVLTYNLIHTTLTSRELGANSDRSLNKLRSLVSRWNDSIEHDLLPSTLAYLFKHQYTDVSLRYDGLKGHDQQVASHLRQVCEEFGFCFYLASMERTVSGGCDDDYSDYGHNSSGFHEIIEECDSNVSLTRVVELDGAEVAKSLAFDHEMFIDSDPFADWEPDDEDYSGYTGNEGVSATHFYRRTVALIMPKSHRIEFFLTPDAAVEDDYGYGYSSLIRKAKQTPKVISWINRLSKNLSQDTDNVEPRDDLGQICKMVIRQMKAWKLEPQPVLSWRPSPSPPHSDEVMLRIVSLTLELGDQNLFVQTYHAYSGRIPLSMWRSIGIALVRFDLQSLLPDLSAQLSAILCLSDRIANLDELHLGFQEVSNSRATPEIFKVWVKSEIDQALSNVAVVMESALDGSTLVAVAKMITSQEIFDKVLPAVKRNVFNIPMAIAFSNGLYDASTAGEIPVDVGTTIFKDVVSDISDRFSLRQLDAFTGNKRVALYQQDNQCLAAIAPTILADEQSSKPSSKNLADLLRNCSLLQLWTDLDLIVSKLTKEAATVDIELFDTIYIPCLKALPPILQGTNTSHKNIFQRLFQQLLAIYIVRYVKDEPTYPQDWSRRPLKCTCNHCQALINFLLSPVEKEYRMKGLVGNRKHVESCLGIGFKCETDKRRSPHALVITKTTAIFTKEHNAWKHRSSNVSKILKDLGSNKLKVYLAEMYNHITTISVANLIPIVQRLGTLSQLPLSGSDNNTSNRILPPITNRKLPSQVVVIDD